MQEFGAVAVVVTVFSRVWCCGICFIVEGVVVVAVAVDVAVVSVVVVIEAAVDSDVNVTFIGV